MENKISVSKILDVFEESRDKIIDMLYNKVKANNNEISCEGIIESTNSSFIRNIYIKKLIIENDCLFIEYTMDNIDIKDDIEYFTMNDIYEILIILNKDEEKENFH